MTFVSATGWLTWHVSSWSELEYVYYHKVQHPFYNNDHQSQPEVICFNDLLLSMGKIL